MKHVVLTSDPTAWVDLRDVADIPERLRRPARRIQMLLASSPAFGGVVKDALTKGATTLEDFSPEQQAGIISQMGSAYELLDELNDHQVIERVMGWSFGPEVTMEALQDLPGAVYDELRELVAGAPAGTPDFSPSPESESPTEPSSA